MHKIQIHNTVMITEMVTKESVTIKIKESSRIKSEKKLMVTEEIIMKEYSSPKLKVLLPLIMVY